MLSSCWTDQGFQRKRNTSKWGEACGCGEYGLDRVSRSPGRAGEATQPSQLPYLRRLTGELRGQRLGSIFGSEHWKEDGGTENEKCHGEEEGPVPERAFRPVQRAPLTQLAENRLAPTCEMTQRWPKDHSPPRKEWAELNPQSSQGDGNSQSPHQPGWETSR